MNLSLYNEYVKQFALENNDNTTKAREFCKEVEKLAKKFNLSFFLVTEGASIIRNNNCPAVKAARDAHIEWEKRNGHDPYEDWSK